MKGYDKVQHESVQGRRSDQEDRYVVEFDENPQGVCGWLFGVFDGSGGPNAAEQAALEFPVAWTKKRQLYGKEYAKALHLTMRDLHRVARDEDIGSTASLVYIPLSMSRAYFETIGDSPIIAKNGRGESYFSLLHNIGNSAEKLLVHELGGTIGVGGESGKPVFTGPGWPHGTQLSRALGFRGATFMSRTSVSGSIPLVGKSFVLVGSDGLFSFKSEQISGEYLIEQVSMGVDVHTLVQEAAKVGKDNVTAILWRK